VAVLVLIATAQYRKECTIMRRLGSITAIALLTLAAALAGCRGGDGTATDTGEGGIKTGDGVTAEACPDAVNPDNGCIYLGIISDLTVGPFKALAVPITDSQKAFWKRVNDSGGIGGYDIDVTKYIRDNKYVAETHNQVYQEIKGDILALAQTLGSPTTAAIISDLKRSSIVAAPASWTSAWAFEDVIVESGANYCVESMNAIDYAIDTYDVKTVMAVHYPGDYGDDAAAGAKLGAEARDLTFIDVKTDPGVDKQAGAINEIVSQKPDLVVLTAAPAETATIVGQAAARGFTGRFIGTSPSWNPGLIASPAAPALKALYEQTAPWDSWGTDSPGHAAMREAIGTQVTPNDGYTAGWVWSYPLKAALEKAAENKDLTREGVLNAVKQLNEVDYEGMLPSGAGNFAAGVDGQVKVTAIYKPDDAAPTKVSQVKELFTGETAEAFKLEGKPCYDQL
jgi:ABC-type branched-subunit amino acid transport system substrate-binding protein